MAEEKKRVEDLLSSSPGDFKRFKEVDGQPKETVEQQIFKNYLRRLQRNFPEFAIKIEQYGELSKIPTEYVNEFSEKIGLVEEMDRKKEKEIDKKIQELAEELQVAYEQERNGIYVPEINGINYKVALLKNKKIREDLIDERYTIEDLFKEAEEIVFEDVSLSIPKSLEQGVHPKIIKEYQQYLLEGAEIGSDLLDKLMIRGWNFAQISRLGIFEPEGIINYGLSLGEVKSTKIQFDFDHLEALKKGEKFSVIKDLDRDQLSLVAQGNLPGDVVAKAKSTFLAPVPSMDILNFISNGSPGTKEERRALVIKHLPKFQAFQWRAFLSNKVPEEIVQDPKFTEEHQILLSHYSWHDTDKDLGLKHVTHPAQLRALDRNVIARNSGRTTEKLTVRDVCSDKWTILHTIAVGDIPVKDLVNKDAKSILEILMTPINALAAVQEQEKSVSSQPQPAPVVMSSQARVATGEGGIGEKEKGEKEKEELKVRSEPAASGSGASGVSSGAATGVTSGAPTEPPKPKI